MDAPGNRYEKNPNPQGKGLVPVLQDWHAMQPVAPGHHTADGFLREYALSSLVLAAEFRFKPAVGVDYYLYSTECGWKLSLIAPQQRGRHIIGDYFARCRLRPDMTWSVEATDGASTSDSAPRAANFLRAFIETLNAQESIPDSLPSYVAELPYYRRLLASGLAASLAKSVVKVEGQLRGLLTDLDACAGLLDLDGRADPHCGPHREVRFRR